MIKKNDREGLPSDSGCRMMLLLLLIAGMMEFLFIIMESLFSYIGYYLVEDYIIVPCLLFVGLALGRKLPVFAKHRLLLAGAAVAWFVIAQFIHKLSGSATHPIGTVLCVYLMAFPFAAVMEDKNKTGLHILEGIFLGAAMVHVFYTILLLADKVPEFMRAFVYWDGARLHAFWHSNINACLFMIGICFALSFFFHTKKTWAKIILAAAVLLQFFAMALTNCRTVLLMTSALFGGTAFLVLVKKDWKRIAAAVVAALVLMVASFWVSGKLYDRHNAVLREKVAEHLQQEAVVETVPQSSEVPEETIVQDTGTADVTEAEIAEDTAEVPEQQETAAPELTETSPREETVAAETQEAAAEETADDFRINYVENKETGEVKLVSQNGQGTLLQDLLTLNGRSNIWRSTLNVIRDNHWIALWGTEDVEYFLSTYHHFDLRHTHNSWMEVLMRLGLPGLLMALLFTWIAIRGAWVVIWNQTVSMSHKMVAMLTMCLLVAGMLEPYLFITNVYYHIIDFVFFFCTGYLDYWRHQLSEKTA